MRKVALALGSFLLGSVFGSIHTSTLEHSEVSPVVAFGKEIPNTRRAGFLSAKLLLKALIDRGPRELTVPAEDRLIRNRSGAGAIAAAAIASSFSFFLITNFMVWAADRLYPLTIGGLSECYLAGIPFYRNQVLGDAVYTVAIFGGYAILNRLCQPARQAA